jgi:S1-C subfamily serine protease
MPGEQAGLRVGDVITHIADNEIESRDAIFRELAAYAPDVPIAFTVRRPRGSDILHVDTSVVLSKRYMSTKRPAFTLEPQTTWHGAVIDYATAFPPELLFQFYSRYSGFEPRALAVVAVEPKTEAWEAGFRLGQQILAINGQHVETPEDFYRLATPEGQAIVRVRDFQGRELTISIN